MDTKRTISAFVGMVVGLLLGALILTGWHAVRYDQYESDRRASDQCWVDGGDYRDGTCEMPKKSDILVRAEKACADDNFYILEGDPVIYCIDDKHGVYKVEAK